VHEPQSDLPDGSDVLLTPDVAPEPDAERTFRGRFNGDAEARLYQSGPYDHVIVIPEPFNRREQSEFGRRTKYDLWRRFDVLLPYLYAYGYDVWVVQARQTGENVHEQAAAVAQAIAYAATFQGGPQGGKVVVAGFSLAGPVVRIATARWQSDAAWRAELALPSEVPASLLIFGDAPLRGAQVNYELQRLLWQKDKQNQVNLNSCTAQQLIRSGIGSAGGGQGINEQRFRVLGGAISFSGDGICDDFDGTNCHCRGEAPVESFGPLHDGWAQGIRKIAFSNGSWDPPKIKCYGGDLDREYGVDLCPEDPGGNGAWTPDPGAVFAHVEIDGSLPLVCDIFDKNLHVTGADIVAGSRLDGLLNESSVLQYPICDSATLHQRFAPTFMPITSALATDVPYSNGPFDAVRVADHHGFHEQVAPETLNWVIEEIAAATGGTPPEDEAGNPNVPPRPPSDLTAMTVPRGENKVALHWRDRSNNERGFVVYRLRSGETGWRWRADLEANETSFVDEVDVLPQPPDTTTYYFYQVQAYNTAGDSGWSNRADANMYEPFPYRPITDAPPGCATSLRPRFHWFGASYSSSYWVHVSDDESGQEIFDDMLHPNEELVLPFPLQEGHRYSYIVSGRNNLHQGPWSERRYFIPLCTPLTAPVLTAPLHCTGPRPTLDWEPVPGAHGYVVKLRQVSTVPGVDDPYVFPADNLPWVETDQLTLPFDLPPADYWFQVKAGDGVNTGAWSGYRYFTAGCTTSSPPGVANPISPGGQVLTNTPTYRWETGHDATSYRLLVQHRPDNTSVYDAEHAAADICTVTACAVTPAAPLPPGSYHFYVQSLGHGAAPFGPSAIFTVPELPTLTVGDASVAEAAAGDVDVHIPLTLTAPAGPAVRLRWRTVDDTAHAPGDYLPHDEIATFVEGETRLDLVVRVRNDAVHEGPERFLVRLFDLQGAGATDTEAAVTIADDDAVPVLLAADVLETEPAAGGQLESAFRVDALGTSEQPIDVPYTLQACTATPGSDYVAAASGALHFESGAGSQSVPFTVLGDHALEGHEVFTLVLGAASGATVGKGLANATLTEHDGPALGILRADFDHDGHNDLVWNDPTGNRYGIWSLRGPHRLGETAFVPAAPADQNWKLAGVGDFDGNATPDLLWRNQDSGRLSVWFMNGTARTGAVVFDGRPDSTVAGVANFGGDLTPDILWRGPDRRGSLSVWIMQGTTLVSEQPLTPAAPVEAGWTLQATGDLDGDGRPDLLWRNGTSGALVAWLMNGTTRVGGGPLTPSGLADLNWRVVAAQDIDADGTTDIVWQDATSGRIVTWLMAGTTRRCAAPLVNDAAGRVVLGPR